MGDSAMEVTSEVLMKALKCQVFNPQLGKDNQREFFEVLLILRIYQGVT